MARYSRIIGPALDYTVTAVETVIPGFSVTREWDDGELLLLVSSRIAGSVLSSERMQLRPRIDLDPATALNYILDTETTLDTTFAFATLLQMTAGRHTIDLTAVRVDPVAFTIRGGRTELILIQLPLWDSVANLVVL